MFALVALLPMKAKDRTRYVDARELTIVGKLFPDMPHFYHRLDTSVYHGFIPKELTQIIQSSGIAIAFRTDSDRILVKTEYGFRRVGNFATGIALHGYDLYIKKDGKWLYASSGVAADDRQDQPFTLIGHMDGSMHECLLYLPLYSEVLSVEIGVDEKSTLEAIDNPFRHRVGIFGSSYTHGAGASRSGLSYPAIFSRSTGIQLLSLGVSGNSKLQPAFARALADADVDAYIFDAFSNPSIAMIEERLFPFIETIQEKHPDIPLIFMKTIYCEGGNFNLAKRKHGEDRRAFVDKKMAEACRKYKNVYYIASTNATSKDHETSIEGTHPNDYGYMLWERSIEKPVLRILRKYGIR